MSVTILLPFAISVSDVTRSRTATLLSENFTNQEKYLAHRDPPVYNTSKTMTETGDNYFINQ